MHVGQVVEIGSIRKQNSNDILLGISPLNYHKSSIYKLKTILAFEKAELAVSGPKHCIPNQYNFLPNYG